MTARILVVATSPAIDRYQWFEELVVGSTNRPVRVEVRPGGKAMNGSRVLRRLGADVTVVVPVPADERSWWATAAAAEGIELVPAPATGQTRQTITCIDATARCATEIYEPARVPEAADWLDLCRIAGECLTASRPDALVIAGSAQTDDGGALAEIARQAGAAGMPCFVDGIGAAITRTLAQHPAWIKVNLAEAQDLADCTGCDASSSASALLALGPRAAVVTAGAAGGAWATADAAGLVDAPGRPGPYPGGSGDAFMAGLVVEIVGGSGIPAAISAARRAAEENAWSPYAGGARPG